MGNLQVIEALFDKWFGDTVNRNTDVPVCPSTYVRAKKTDCNQSVFSIAEDSFHRLLEVSDSINSVSKPFIKENFNYL
jgi:hypothetical protein